MKLSSSYHIVILLVILGLILPSILYGGGGGGTPNATQIHYRVRDDSTALNTDGGWLAGEDTIATGVSTTTPFRLRFQLSNEGTGQSKNVDYYIQWAVRTGTTCGDETFANTPIPSGQTTEHFQVSLSTQYFNSDNIPTNLLTPESTTFVSGRGFEQNSVKTGFVTLKADEYTEYEWAMEGTADISSNENYCFRLSPSDTYAVYAEIQTEQLAGSNSVPVASAVSIDSDAASITLNEGTTKNVVCSGTVTDADGFADITSVKADLFRTGVGIGSATDNNNHYQESGDSECVPSGGSGTSETYTCTIPVQYYADPTDTGSPNSADDWTCTLTPTDATEEGTAASDTIEMNSSIALSVSETDIAYGTVNANTDTGATNQTITVENTGNRDIDPQLSGANMTSGGDNIVVSQQEYSATTFTYGAGTDLSASATTLDITLPQPTNDGAPTVQDTVYWGLGVPNGTPTGTYAGSNTVSATAGI